VDINDDVIKFGGSDYQQNLLRSLWTISNNIYKISIENLAFVKGILESVFWFLRSSYTLECKP